MTTHFTDDEIDALGERLRRGITHTDRTRYGSHRRVLNVLRSDLEAELRAFFPNAEAGSRTKRVETVAAKLQRRPDLPLSQVTDLAGCRIIVSGKAEQEAVVTRLLATYDVQQVDDKSDRPKFGYRAVHFDIRYRGQLMEIQVQTRNQHLWQMVSEMAAGYDISIKYGGGLQEVNRALQDLSELAWRCDLEGTELPDADIDQARDVITSAHSG
ncbi:MAG: RelA/SpoT domain-containing protein [Chloroflexi bacterium]|nr:RelA/SpoT domain-containing protein [Chloroflexota bacterium]